MHAVAKIKCLYISSFVTVSLSFFFASLFQIHLLALYMAYSLTMEYDYNVMYRHEGYRYSYVYKYKKHFENIFTKGTIDINKICMQVPIQVKVIST